MTAGKAQVGLKHLQSSAWYVLASQTHLLKVPKCLGQAVENLQQHLSGEKPSQTKLIHWLVSWWHFRAPKESWPPSVSSDSLPDLKKLCFLVWLCFAALKPVTKLNLNVEFIYLMKAQTFQCRHHLRHTALVASSEWKRVSFCWNKLSRVFVCKQTRRKSHRAFVN